jgi:signal transduction histidine kinase
MKRWGWRYFLAVGAVLTVVYYSIGPNIAKLGVWPAIGLASSLAIVAGARWHRPASPGAWYLFAAAQVTLVAGDTLYNIRVLVLHQQQPFPSLVDLCYLLTYPLLILGLLLLIRRRSPGRDLGSLLDAAIVTTGIGLLSWEFLISPYIRAAGLSPGERLVAIAYPLGDVLVLAVAARLAIGSGWRPPAWWLVAVSVVGLLVADSLFSYSQLQGTWQPGGPVDIGWILFYVCWGVAALHPSMMELSKPEAPAGQVTRARLVVLGAVILLAPAVLVVQYSRGEPLDTWMYAGAAAALFLLALARVNGLAGELARQHERERTVRRIVNVNAADRERVMVGIRSGPIEALTSLQAELATIRKFLAFDAGPTARRDAEVRLATLERDVSKEIHALRAYISHLRPPVLEQLGLAHALRSRVELFADETDVRCTIDVSDIDLPHEAEAMLYRVTEEALADISTHDRVNVASISLETSEDRTLLRIYDNGTGRSSPTIPEWVEMMGGRLTVDSAPQTGTTITVELAMQPAR